MTPPSLPAELLAEAERLEIVAATVRAAATPTHTVWRPVDPADLDRQARLLRTAADVVDVAQNGTRLDAELAAALAVDIEPAEPSSVFFTPAPPPGAFD